MQATQTMVSVDNAASSNFKDTIRVLHVTYPLVRGGIETWLLHVLKYRAPARYQMDFATHRLGCDLEDEYKRLGANIIKIPRADHPLAHWHGLRRVIEKHGPYDIVHSHVHHSGIEMRICEAAGVPVRITHAHTSVAAMRDVPLGQRLVLSLTARWIRRYATAGLAVSEQAAQAFFGQDWHQDRRWRILHCGIDLAPFRRPAPEREQLLAELGLPATCRIVGNVGRLAPPKNHLFLLKIAQIVVKRHRDVHFVLVGDGPLRSQMERAVAARGLTQHVHLLGSVNNVPELMRSLFDVMVFPSLYEGLPLVVAESQAANLRAIVSNAIPKEAIVVPNLIEYAPLEAGAEVWAEKTIQTLSRPQAQLPDKSLSMVEASDFNIEVSARTLLHVYESLLNLRRENNGAFAPRQPA